MTAKPDRCTILHFDCIPIALHRFTPYYLFHYAGMYVYGDGHQIERNTIALNLWTGSYNGRSESKNVYYESSFEMAKVGSITFKDNIVSVSYWTAAHVGDITNDCGPALLSLNNGSTYNSLHSVDQALGSAILCCLCSMIPIQKILYFRYFIHIIVGR